MKKTLTYFIGIVVISISACKKDYTCTCNASNGREYVNNIEKTTKKKAKDNCAAYKAYVGGSTITGLSVSCELK